MFSLQKERTFLVIKCFVSRQVHHRRVQLHLAVVRIDRQVQRKIRKGELRIQADISTPAMSFLVRTSGNLRFIPVFSHHIREKFDATRLRQIVHPVHLSERKDMSVILQRNHAPVLNLIILTSDTADMKSPDAIIGMLVIS